MDGVTKLSYVSGKYSDIRNWERVGCVLKSGGLSHRAGCHSRMMVRSSRCFRMDYLGWPGPYGCIGIAGFLLNRAQEGER